MPDYSPVDPDTGIDPTDIVSVEPGERARYAVVVHDTSGEAPVVIAHRYDFDVADELAAAVARNILTWIKENR